MAMIHLFSHFPCKNLIPSSSNTKSHSKSPIILPINSFNRRSEFGISIQRPDFKVRATDVDDEWGKDAVEGVLSSSVAEKVADEATESIEEIERLKRSLVDSLYGTDRGFNASSETRGEISELITKLESKNPTPAPEEALFLLNGKWILAYTSFVGLFPLLSHRIEPLIKADEISETIDSDNLTVQNSVRFAGPFSTTSFSTNAKFEFRSPKRVQIKFEQGIIGTPQLTDSIEIPESVEVLGQKIDLKPIRGLLTPVQDTTSSVTRTISNKPPLKFPLPSDNTQLWLLTTYLDKDLRISRGDAGSVFVFIKEGSSLS